MSRTREINVVKQAAAKELATKYAAALGNSVERLEAALYGIGRTKSKTFTWKTSRITFSALLDDTIEACEETINEENEGGNADALRVLDFAERLIAQFRGKRLRVCKDRFFTMRPNGVLDEYEDGFNDIERFAIAFLAKEATPKHAAEALRLALALMANGDLRETFAANARTVAPLLCAADSAGQACWERVDIDLSPGATMPPRFGEWVSRVQSDAQREALYVFLGSLFDQGSDRTQYLYLWAEGGDGKSVFIEMLRTMLRRATYVTRGDAYQKNFGRASVEGKRLVVLQEEGRSGFLSSPAFKELTGDSAIEVERKYCQPYMIDIQAKVIAVSNYPPLLSGGRADERRIIPVKLKGLDSVVIDLAFKAEFIAEGPAIARFCFGRYQAWKAANPNGALIGDPEELRKIRNNTAAATALAFVETVFVRQADNHLPVENVTNELKKYSGGLSGNFLFNKAMEVFETWAGSKPSGSGASWGYPGVALRQSLAVQIP